MPYMHLKILLFGIARDIAGNSTLEIEAEQGISAGELKADLLKRYPRFERVSSLLLAVNNEYAADSAILYETDEIALIPPVSGG